MQTTESGNKADGPFEGPANVSRTATAKAPHAATRVRETGVAVRGRLVSEVRRRGWHAVGLLTGLILVRHGVALVGRLLGFSRWGTVRVEEDGLVVEGETRLLGSRLVREELRIASRHVVGTCVARRLPALILLLGALVGIGLVLAGIAFLVDGILVKVTSLTLAGAGILCLGVGVDLATRALARFLEGRRGVEVMVLGPAGPLVTLRGVDEEAARRFSEAVARSCLGAEGRG